MLLAKSNTLTKETLCLGVAHLQLLLDEVNHLVCVLLCVEVVADELNHHELLYQVSSHH